MTLSERLKIARDSLGHTQNEIASKVSVSVQMWRAYESGKSVPGGNVLEALARLGFNVNWLLTGLGSMWLVSAGDVWSENFREVRGNLTIPEFVKKLGFKDPDSTVATIQAIENKELDPDWSILIVLSTELGINLDWFIGWHDVPMLRSEVRTRNTLDVEEDILEILSGKIKETTKQMGITIHPEKLITLSMTLYKFYSRNFLTDPKFRDNQMDYIVKALIRLTLPDPS